MSDTSTPAPTPAPAPAVDEATAAELATLRAQVATLTAAATAAAAAPAGPVAPPVVRGTVKAGDLVSHTWEDPTGTHTAYGLATSVDASSDLGDRVELLWFRGKGGPIFASELEVLPHS